METERNRADNEAAGGVDRSPRLLKEAFDVFARASRQLEKSYEELKVRADRLAMELAATNSELEKQLAEKERIGSFLNNILESITSGILVVGPDGKAALSNEAAERMLGLAGSPEGRPADDAPAPKPIAEFIAECASPDLQGTRSREVQVQQQSGRRHFALSYAPVLDSLRNKVGSLIVIQDVTRLKLLEEQALRNERLAAMGEMAAELAHEIRNPLGGIELFASLLSRDVREDANRKLADNIVVGVKSLNAVVTNMLTFTRPFEVNQETFELNEFMRETLGFMERVIGAQGIDLRLELSDSLGEIEADPELLKQVILNLAQNAVQAMQGGGTLRVATSLAGADSDEPAAVIRIEDTGCGIAPEHLPRVFDPFFSLRRGGTGLGLSVATQIVGRHGGVLAAESEPGRGTAMTISLPLRPRQNAEQ